MKRNSIFIYVALICLFASFSANAQRPVWVVAHACNSHQCLINAVRDGASGVEIDIHTIFEHADNDWSVNHGSKNEKYLDPTEREKRNKSEDRTGIRRYVSLKEYLNFEEMDKINILWLDVKTANCGKGLVKYVHEILLERYHSIDKVPFSIIYGFYGRMDYCVYITDIGSQLWSNEGISLAYEGKTGNEWSSGTFGDIEDWMNKYNLPIEQHFMTCGFGPGVFVNPDSIEPQCIKQAREKMLKDQYCSRVGFWTCTQDVHGLNFVCAKDDYGYSDSYGTECDLVLMECDTEFYPLNFPGFNRWTLQNFINKFFKENGAWYKFNRGDYRLATKDDKFYIKYSDPRRSK